ncbi:TfoX/Sxy family protein [Nocardia colli]|uniref:TfoX/Sxy family protein n=1 Tax=Nocardia colli TaxID=2545717 RepID=A0A5N0E6J3_9NOCA|nr:TfoX/Sxy family protein [Nocardia colli]KAA8884049.1 TfoX/Sxy family protein [Nocardia colli]
MSTDKATVAGILEQLEPLDVRARAMFGEYGLYCDDKLVALIADDHLFVKPTAVATGYADESWLAPPYPGAKDYYRVPAPRLADTAWLGEFVQRTAEVLPVRVPKSRKPSAKPR